MSLVDTNSDYNPWDATIGPNGIPRINVTAPSSPTPVENPYPYNAEGVPDYQPSALPIQGIPKPTTYIMEPDLMQAQTGKLDVPKDVSFDDSGVPYNNVTGQPVKVVRRPNVLPIAVTPEGPTFAMPKMLDIVGNVMSPLAAGAVPVKAGEMVLGSGIVRTVPEATEAAKAAEPFYSTLEQAVSNAKIGKADASQWLGYLKNQPGVKAEEIGQVLNNLPEGQITKEALQGIVKDNAVKLNEVVKTTEESRIKDLDEAAKDRYGEYFDELGSEQQGEILNELKFNPTKYHSYQLPGGENYKEMLLTLPSTTSNLKVVKNSDGFFNIVNSKNEVQNIGTAGGTFGSEATALQVLKQEKNIGNFYKSSHWDEPNILAHVRMNDRNIPDVGKSLHLEEIQSDWHQAGRKKGYALSKDQLDKIHGKFEKIDEKLLNSNDEELLGHPDLDGMLKMAVDKKVITPDEADIYKKVSSSTISGAVPDAPFKTTWPDLAFKRMLHKAATEGYDAVSWTPGEAQAARYDLSKHLDYVEYSPKAKALTAYDKNGNQVIHKQNIENKDLPDLIGKEAAEKIINNPSKKQDEYHILENADLKIGGEGMKSFYDKMLVDKANALAKKFGAKVETKNLATGLKDDGLNTKLKDNGYDPNNVDIQEILADNGGRLPNWLNEEELEIIKRGDNITEHNLDQKMKGRAYQPIHVLKLTPELKARAKQGFPLFSGTPILNPVDFNPFEQQQSNYKLTPVQGNPFQ